MNISQIISELLSERKRLDEAILALNQLDVPGPRKRGRPRKWVTEIAVPGLYQARSNGTSHSPAKLPGNGDRSS